MVKISHGFELPTLDRNPDTTLQAMTSTHTYVIEPLSRTSHDRAAFECGVEPLNDYVKVQAAQDLKRKAAGCWVLTHRDSPQTILGYYTLSPEAVELSALGVADPELLKKMPRYPRLGAVLLGRLAVDLTAQGKGLGELLLLDAMARVLHAEIPAVLMVTDPKDAKAESFYRKFTFEPLNTERMFSTMPRIAKLLMVPG